MRFRWGGKHRSSVPWAAKHVEERVGNPLQAQSISCGGRLEAEQAARAAGFALHGPRRGFDVMKQELAQRTALPVGPNALSHHWS
jgi:hypothetical protein